MISAATEPLTTELNNGLTVLAKLYQGHPTPKTFANITQATKAVENLGPGWFVSGHRPYYAAKLTEEYLQRRFDETCEDFQNKIAELAFDAAKEVLDVYKLWREYSEFCRNADQSAIMSEFQEWYRGQLKPAVITLPTVTVREGS